MFEAFDTDKLLELAIRDPLDFLQAEISEMMHQLPTLLH
jgi:hypothetical protein